LKHFGSADVTLVNAQGNKETEAMTIGDILAVIAAVLLVGASWAATILTIALAFPARVAAAQAKLTAAPGVCLVRGLAVLLVSAVLAIALSKAAAGPVRGLALLLLGGLGVVAALGSAAVVRLLGARIDALGSPMTPFASLTRASVLYVAAGFLPVIGWGVVLPAALLLSVGSGVAVLGRAKPQARPVPPLPPPVRDTLEIAA